MQMPKYMKSNYHIAYLSTFVRTTITLIDPHTTYLYNKGERSYCYFTLYPQSHLNILNVYVFGKEDIKRLSHSNFSVDIHTFSLQLPSFRGNHNLNKLKSKLFKGVSTYVSLFCLIILQKKISNTFLYLFLRNILSLPNCRQNYFSGNQYLNKLLSLLQGYVSQKFKLFQPNSFEEDCFSLFILM